MTDKPPTARPHPGSRWKLAGILVLILGLVSAGLVYWIGSRSAAPADDLTMLQFNRPKQRQMQMLYGKHARLIEDLSNGLKQPGTQAFLIATTTAIMAGVCFHLSKPRT